MIFFISMYFFEKKSYGPPYDFFFIFKYFFDKKSYGPPYDFFDF